MGGGRSASWKPRWRVPGARRTRPPTSTLGLSRSLLRALLKGPTNYLFRDIGQFFAYPKTFRMSTAPASRGIQVWFFSFCFQVSNSSSNFHLFEELQLQYQEAFTFDFSLCASKCRIQVRIFTCSKSCSSSIKRHSSSIFLFISKCRIQVRSFTCSLFGTLRVFAKISLASLCVLPAVRPLEVKQASESTADPRKPNEHALTKQAVSMIEGSGLRGRDSEIVLSEYKGIHAGNLVVVKVVI